jgi:translation initiation factor 1
VNRRMEHSKKYHALADLGDLVGSQTSIPLPQNKKHDGKGKTVHVSLDTQGRKGKVVTLVSGLQHNPSTMDEIARSLKQFCGTGGTVKEGKIELQGDQRVRAAGKLKEMNYRVKETIR